MRKGNAVDVLIVGAGPYGLSLAAQLQRRGADYRVVGHTMGGWRDHMPPKMLLKSQPWASNIANPDYTIGDYYQEKEIRYDPVFHYVPLQTFIDYGETFQNRFVAPVEQKTVVSLSNGYGRFVVRCEDGETIEANKVVVAVGLVPFRYLPRMVDQFPAELVSHSCDYGPFDQLKGKRVIIVGAGSSAIDLAVLLSEAGIENTMLARRLKLEWGEPPGLRLLRDRIRYPDAGIGTSWLFMVAVYAPWAVHYLPDHLRLRFAFTGGLGPLGGFPMRHRFEQKVTARFGVKIDRMNINDSKVDLTVIDAENKSTVFSADHVIFATGYKIDVNRLGFLDPVITSKMNLVDAAPRLSRHYESSIPGLYFIGPAAAPSFGPVCRFVHGTKHPSRHLAHYLSPQLVSSKLENVRRDEEVVA